MKSLVEILPRFIKVCQDLLTLQLSQEGITFAQSKVLKILYMRNKLSQRELADKAFVEPATMSRVIDGMVEKGFITRENDKNSRRSNVITITDLGKEKIDNIKKNANSLENEMFKNFTETEKLEFLEAFDRLCNR